LDTLFPNLSKFYLTSSSTSPVGVVKNLLPDYLFDWAEKTYPNYFSPAKQKSFEQSGYTLRYYPSSNNYVGIKNGRVYVYGDVFGGLVNVGALSDMLDLASI